MAEHQSIRNSPRIIIYKSIFISVSVFHKILQNIFELLLNLFTKTRFEKQLEIVMRTISFTWTPDNHQGVFQLQHDPYFGR